MAKPGDVQMPGPSLHLNGRKLLILCEPQEKGAWIRDGALPFFVCVFFGCFVLFVPLLFFVGGGERGERGRGFPLKLTASKMEHPLLQHLAVLVQHGSHSPACPHMITYAVAGCVEFVWWVQQFSGPDL